jgi:2-methylisocitrate lyase-like PEP mutase family enzyme
MTPQQRLREQLHDDAILVAPGVYDALSANLAARAGFTALYVSGASIAYTRLARPDLGYLGADQVAEIVRNIRERTELPLIVDADTGVGNALNVQRTVQILEQAGSSAIQLEDQSMPKRCGHLDGKTLVPTAEMAGKIRAATDARRDDATLIVAPCVGGRARKGCSLCRSGSGPAVRRGIAGRRTHAPSGCHAG